MIYSAYVLSCVLVLNMLSLIDQESMRTTFAVVVDFGYATAMWLIVGLDSLRDPSDTSTYTVVLYILAVVLQIVMVGLICTSSVLACASEDILTKLKH